VSCYKNSVVSGAKKFIVLQKKNQNSLEVCLIVELVLFQKQLVEEVVLYIQENKMYLILQERKQKKLRMQLVKDGMMLQTFFKFAKVNRHQNQSLNKQSKVDFIPTQITTIDVMNDKIDELAQKIFRQMKNDICLEYARVGKG